MISTRGPFVMIRNVSTAGGSSWGKAFAASFSTPTAAASTASAAALPWHRHASMMKHNQNNNNNPSRSVAIASTSTVAANAATASHNHSPAVSSSPSQTPDFVQEAIQRLLEDATATTHHHHYHHPVSSSATSSVSSRNRTTAMVGHGMLPGLNQQQPQQQQQPQSPPLHQQQPQHEEEPLISNEVLEYTAKAFQNHCTNARLCIQDCTEACAHTLAAEIDAADSALEQAVNTYIDFLDCLRVSTPMQQERFDEARQQATHSIKQLRVQLDQLKHEQEQQQQPPPQQEPQQ